MKDAATSPSELLKVDFSLNKIDPTIKLITGADSPSTCNKLCSPSVS